MADDELPTTSQQSSGLPPTPSHLFVELTSLDDLSFPASSSKRTKFTCVCASSRSLVFGTSSGTVYVFSRFRTKTRSASTPIDVFTTKDGPVYTVKLSPCDQYVAVGSDSGRVSVATLAANGVPTRVEYTVAGEPRNPDKVTALAWDSESKSVYSGHSSGTVRLHRLGVRNMFRSSQEVVQLYEGAVVQMDLSKNRLLVSTTIASHIYETELGRTSQVGTKTRNCKMGACFVTSLTGDGDTAVDCEFIAAARPNGRMWEANDAGAVYNTHQFRQSSLDDRRCSTVPRCSYISYREEFEGILTPDDDGLESAPNTDISLFLLKKILSNNMPYVLTYYGSRLIVLDVETSKVLLLTDVGSEIIDLSVCGADVFMLLNGRTFIRKLSLLTLAKTLEKLVLRSSFSQAAQLVLQFNNVDWDQEIVNSVEEGLNSGKKDRKQDHLRTQLQNRRRECDRAGIQSNYSPISNALKSAKSPSQPFESFRGPGGIYRVQANNVSSGYGDDLNFRLPATLRERSYSNPCVETSTSPNTALSKQYSMPLTSNEIEFCSRHGTPDVTKQDILERAKHILESDGHIVERESLKTLLQLETTSDDEDLVKFTPTVTVNNAAKALAELALKTPLDVAAMLSQTQLPASNKKRKGPTIIKRKPIRPGVRPRSIEMQEKPAVDTNLERKESDVSTDLQALEPAEVWIEKKIAELSFRPEAPSSSRSSTASLSSESKSRSPSDRCSKCKVHRCWLAAALLSGVVRKIRLKEDYIDKGAIPSSIDAWKALLAYRLEIPSKSNSICACCEAGLSHANKALANLPSDYGLTPTPSTSPNLYVAPKNLSAQEAPIRDRFFEKDDERVKLVLFGETCPVENGGGSEKLIAIKAKSSKDSDPPCLNGTISTLSDLYSDYSNDFKHHFTWIADIEFDTLLFLCALVLGSSNLLTLLSQASSICEALSEKNWVTMVKIVIKEQTMKKDLVSVKTIDKILSEAGLSNLLAVETSAPTENPSPLRSSFRTPPAPSSWVVDPKSPCPICAIHLNAIINDSQLPVTSFSCGHSYHSTCLAGRGFCVACRVRARKAAAASKSAHSSPKM